MDIIREALRKRLWFCMLDPEDREAAKSDIERALVAAYNEGHKDGSKKQRAIDTTAAGLAAMVEEE